MLYLCTDLNKCPNSIIILLNRYHTHYKHLLLISYSFKSFSVEILYINKSLRDRRTLDLL
jgi:hypothetical protein